MNSVILMVIYNTLFLNRINGSLELYDPNKQQKIKLTLFKPWVYFPFSKISFLTHIRVINAFQTSETEFESTPDTLLIINPDILINARTISSAQTCPRQSFLQFIKGESKPNLPMVRGLIIHDAYSLIVSQNYSVRDALTNVIDKYKFTLSFLSLEIDELKEEVTPVILGLSKSVVTLQNVDVVPEMTFLSPKYGLMGRMDFWSKNELYELKTGKKIPSKEINTWSSDLYQTLIYMHGLSPFPSKAVKKSFVIYSGLGTPSFRKTDLNVQLLQDIHVARNHCYLFQYEDYHPPVIDIRTCSYCFVKDLCAQFEKIEQEIPQSKSFLYFKHFLSLLQHEHMKNRQDFSLLWKLSPKGRINLGKAIQNLKLLNIEGDTYYYSCRNQSELKAGEPVIISNGDPLSNHTMIASIVSISQSRLALRSSNTLPSSTFIDAYSSDFNYRRLNKNIFDITLGFSSRHESHNILIEGKTPRFIPIKKRSVKNVDRSQLEAIYKAIEAQDFCLIQGPAGTGKTYTIAKLIDELRKNNAKILLTAFTNTAVDNIILTYLSTTIFSDNSDIITRLGIEEAVNSQIIPMMVKNKNFSYQDLLKAPIIASTTSTISKSIYNDLTFDIVIVDEATQMAEPYLLSAITKGKKFILVGDDKQLPPLVLSYQANELGLGISLFERLKKRHSEANILLKYQYRMNRELMEFSNKEYYDGKVQAANNAVGEQLLWDLLPSDTDFSTETTINQLILDPNQTLVYVGVSTEFDKKRRVNKGEIQVIKELTNILLNKGLKQKHIGIIAPFRGQVAEISRALSSYKKIVVDTIDRYQGSDKEVIILSLCTVESPNLLEDARRFNVALTRAKKKMIIVGNIPTKEAIPQFQTLFSHIEKNHFVVFPREKAYTKDKQIFGKSKKVVLNYSKRVLEEIDLNNDYKLSGKSDICIICMQKAEKENILRCPACNQAYHKQHLEEWLLTHETCAICQSAIKIIP
ncbi:MAG: AAA domain-containing protein [Candidatus Hodarchaeales archaeon]